MLPCFHPTNRLLLTVFLLIGSIHLMANGSGQFSLHLISFKTNNVKDDDGGPCDTLFAGDCDPYFDISSVSCGDNCTIGTTKTTKYFENQNSITFENDLGNGLTNPLLYTFTSWTGSFNVTIKSYDHDTGGPDDLIGEFNLSSHLIPTWGAQSPVAIQLTLSTRRSVNLTLNYSAACFSGYYGEGCEVFCNPRDNDTGHYTCDVNNGSKTCLGGWSGDDCLVAIVQASTTISTTSTTTRTQSLISLAQNTITSSNIGSKFPGMTITPGVSPTTNMTDEINPTWTQTPVVSSITDTGSTGVPPTTEGSTSFNSDLYGPIIGTLVPLLVAFIIGAVLYRKVKRKRRERSVDPETEDPKPVESEAVT